MRSKIVRKNTEIKEGSKGKVTGEIRYMPFNIIGQKWTESPSNWVGSQGSLTRLSIGSRQLFALLCMGHHRLSHLACPSVILKYSCSLPLLLHLFTVWCPGRSPLLMALSSKELFTRMEWFNLRNRLVTSATTTTTTTPSCLLRIDSTFKISWTEVVALATGTPCALGPLHRKVWTVPASRLRGEWRRFRL